MKIRVIHFIDRIGRGGTQAVLYDWLKNIDREKIQFDFLTFNNSQEEYAEKFKELGCNIYQVSRLSTRNIWKFMSDLDEFFKQHKYDIAHGHSKIKNVFFLYAAKRNGVSIRIAHSHNTQFQRMALVGELIKPLLKVVATDFWACSDIAGIWLFGKTAYVHNKIVFVKNGVDTSKFKYDESTRLQYREMLGISDAVVYGHVGKYTEQKNHTFLLETFAEIRKLQPSAMLILIGGGDSSYAVKISKQIHELDMEDCVVQLGLRSDVQNLMQAMDVFILPSLYEGLPVVGVEAQTAGLPILLSDTITDEVGLLSSTHFLSLKQGASEWALQAVRLSENNLDSRVYAAQKIYDLGYDSKLVAGHLQDLYVEITSR